MNGLQRTLIKVLKLDKFDNTREVIEQYLIPTSQVKGKIKELLNEKYIEIPCGKGMIRNKTDRGYKMSYSNGYAILGIYEEYYGGEDKDWEEDVLLKIPNIGTSLFEHKDDIWLNKKPLL